MQRDWKITSVAPILNVADEYLKFYFYLLSLFLTKRRYMWLEFYAMITSIKMRIKSRKMKLLDAFRLFDYNHDGMLSCSELYGGLEWLGMRLQTADIYRIVQYIDKHKDGRIRFSDFETVFHDPDEETVADSGLLDETEFSNVVIQPKMIEELYINKDQERIEKKLEIGQKALMKIEVRVEEINNWRQVWTSEGTGTRSDVSVWVPLIKEYLLSICVLCSLIGLEIPSSDEINIA